MKILKEMQAQQKQQQTLSIAVITLFVIFFIAGCYENNNNYWDIHDAQDKATRDEYLYTLDHATSLNDFLVVQKNNWQLGTFDIDVNLISEKRRSWYINNDPNLSPEIKTTILAGKWKIGMTQKDLYASIGIPESINRTVFSNHIHEQWIYEYDIRVPRTSNIYFYLEDGILTSWQD